MSSMANFLTLLGALLLYLGIVGKGKEMQRALIILVGLLYLYLGLFVIVDPPIDSGSIAVLFGIIGGIVGVGKATIWVITKTDMYQNLNNALKAMPEIRDSVVDFKQKWEKVHNIKD